MGFAPTWLRQVSPLLHMTTLTTTYRTDLQRDGEGYAVGRVCLYVCSQRDLGEVFSVAASQS